MLTKMKGIDIFCASQAATAVCLNNMEESASSSSSASTSSSSAAQPDCGGRAIDRHNPIIRDPRRISTTPFPPSSPQPPRAPKPHQNHKKQSKKTSFLKAKNEQKKKLPVDQKRKGIAEPNENNNDNIVMISKSAWGCTKPGDFISPPGSTRYLLDDDEEGEDGFINVTSEFDHHHNHQVVKFLPLEANKSISVKQDDEQFAEKPPSSRSPDKLNLKDMCMDISVKQDEQFAAKPPPCRAPDQVVVLRVSLHCKGCERKMRKHLSRMEGVSSFNIDFAAKKVTVVGDVTPLEVLASISKVKNAKLWMPPMQVSSASPLRVNNLEIKKYQEAGA